MGGKISSSAKVKVTANLDSELVKAIDGFLKQIKGRSRSQFIEDVLRKWHKEQKRQELESQIEAYYLSLSRAEIEENQEWSKITAHSLYQLWKE